MKFLPFLFAFFIFLGCNSTEQSIEDQSSEADKKEVPEVKKNVPPPGKQNLTEVKQTPPPPANNRTNYYKSTARPIEEIDTKYPYDIDLKNAKGEIVKSSEVLNTKGKPTVVLFWLTTCGPCAKEMAAIQKVYDDWQKETDFKLVSIAVDFPKNYPSFFKRIEDKQFPWESYLDVNREFLKAMPGGMSGMPETFVFDEDWNIVYRKKKYTTGDEVVLFEKIKEAAG